MYKNNQLIHTDSMKEIIYNLPLEGGSMLTQLAELTEKITELENRLDNAPKDFAPPIGTYIYSKTDPSLTYTGTTWTQIAGGTYLTAADETSYITSVLYGTNNLQLTTNNIPSHNHTMAHTHTGPSHTHSTPAHTHTYISPAWLWSEVHNPNWDTVNQIIAPKEGSMIGSRMYTRTTGKTASTNEGVNQGGGTTGSAGGGNTGASSAANTGNAGKGTAFNNMPKSIAIPLWTRTS